MVSGFTSVVETFRARGKIERMRVPDFTTGHIFTPADESQKIPFPDEYLVRYPPSFSQHFSSARSKLSLSGMTTRSILPLKLRA